MLNQRDKWIMWENPDRLRRAMKRPDMETSSDSSQSSSTSSDSSDVSSDDEKTIEQIKGFLPNEKDFRLSQPSNLRRYAIEIHQINNDIRMIKKAEKEAKIAAGQKPSDSEASSSEEESSDEDEKNPED